MNHSTMKQSSPERFLHSSDFRNCSRIFPAQVRKNSLFPHVIHSARRVEAPFVKGHLPLSLDDAEGAEAGDLAGEAGALHYVHDGVNVLVGFGSFFEDAVASFGAATREESVIAEGA
jgi:hypothetical protein